MLELASRDLAERLSVTLPPTPTHFVDVNRARTYIERYRLGILADAEDLGTPFVAGPETVAQEVLGVTKTAGQEINRSVIGIESYHAIREGNYNGLTASQDPGYQLTRRDFSEIQHVLSGALKAHPDDAEEVPWRAEAMEAAIAYGDMGKSPVLHQFMEEHTGTQYVDHDLVLSDYLELLRRYREHPEDYTKPVPDFLNISDLDPRARRLIERVLSVDFHLPQFIQLEILPKHLEALEGWNERDIDFMMLYSLFDIAGAQGDEIQSSSATLTQPLFKSFMQARKHLHRFARGATAREVYAGYTQDYAISMGVDLDGPDDVAAVRLAAGFRYHSRETEGQALRRRYLAQEAAKRMLSGYLNRTGYEESSRALWVYYQPDIARFSFTAVSKALEKLHSETREDGQRLVVPEAELADAMSVAFIGLARVYTEADAALAERGITNGIHKIYAGELARVAQSDPLRLLTDRIHFTFINHSTMLARLVPPDGSATSAQNPER